jgi:hemerythrin superfamily protein
MDALSLLKKQHREVEKLFEKYEEAGSRREKTKLFLQVADLLAAHAELEETIFYPAVMVDETEDELREAVEEHLAVKRVLADLLSMSPDHPQFDAKVQVACDLVEHHVEEEERELFKIVQRIAKGALEDLGAIMEAAFSEMLREQPRDHISEQTGEAAPL